MGEVGDSRGSSTNAGGKVGGGKRENRSQPSHACGNDAGWLAADMAMHYACWSFLGILS